MKIHKDSLDIYEIPFSRFGSYFVISVIEDKLFVRDIRGGDTENDGIFKFRFHNDVTINMTETKLAISNDLGELSIIFQNENVLKFYGNLAFELKYELKKYDAIHKTSSKAYEITSYSKEIKIGITDLMDSVDVYAPWESVDNREIKIIAKKEFDFLIGSYKTVLPESFYEEKNAEIEYSNWLKRIPDGSGLSYRKAAYITWMNFVKPEGILKRPAMYMSKNWMTNIWSWDNCFGAIFLSAVDEGLALDQYLMFSDHQDDSGVYPDFINDAYRSYSCAKPPIYGWTYQIMMQKNKWFESVENLEKVYDTISKQTDFWLKYRMSDMGLPYYIHGNESGWDNGTFYKDGVPVVTPDLSSFLIRQMDFLSDISEKLSKKENQIKWKKSADELFDKLMDTLYVDGEFKAYSLELNGYVKDSQTLQSLLPLIINYRLSDEVKKGIMNTLKTENKYLTEFGFATEAISSPYYMEDGYWRGPIWAPVMLLFIESIKEVGDVEFAKEVSDRFINAMEIGGMAENFDPLTGRGLVDPAFSWTSCVYLHLKS